MSDFLLQTQNKLNAVSPCFCLAKWTSVTMHLESGTTHSCHHPNVHSVPRSELTETSAALHNTGYKIEQRKKMLNGERPAECEYCWKIEDLNTEAVSDRVLKSAAQWSISEYETILKNPLARSYKPKYVEVSFSNTCQFKCSYCSASYSTTWEEELKKFGDYPTGSGRKDVKIFPEDENAYIKAFWEWWPELKSGLHTFRITGGEPLLSPNTFRVMENLLQHPEPELTLALNTNLGAPDILMKKFIGLADQLLRQGAIRKLELFTSIDAFGRRAEYIRHGLRHEVFWQNMEKILSVNPAFRINIMCTFNALSVTSFIELLQKIKELNLKHRSPERELPVFIDISYLRYPDYQSVQVLPAGFIPEMEKIVSFIEDNQRQSDDRLGFQKVEVIKIKRILELMRQGVDPKLQKKLQLRFFSFFSEHDRRRQTEFLKVFPEMKDFWSECEKKHRQDVFYRRVNSAKELLIRIWNS